MKDTQPEALRLADELDAVPETGADPQTIQEAAAELRRLHAYCQELESHLILDCMTHVQNPAENEHVEDDVSKNGAELNMTGSAMRASHGQAQAAPQTSPAAQGDALDAARLDWLESNSQINIERVRYLGATKSIYEVTPYDSIGYDGETLRDAIDAARAAQEGKKP